MATDKAQQRYQPTNSENWKSAATLMERIFASGRKHVPTNDLLDFAVGGLDGQILNALYGRHIDTCETCQHGIDHYERQRPKDLALLNEVPEFACSDTQKREYTLSTGEAKKHLKDFIASESGPLFIIGGEANPLVYDQEIGDILARRAGTARRNNPTTIPQIIVGPAIGLDGSIQTRDDAVLPNLAEQGLIKLYAAKHRMRVHFRVSGEERVYTEAYHSAGDPSPRCGVWYNSRPIAGLFKRRFQAILQAQQLVCEAGRDGFVYLPMERIKQLQNKFDEKYDSFDADEIRVLAPDCAQ